MSFKESVTEYFYEYCNSCFNMISWPGAPEWAEHINDTEKDVGSELTLSCTAVGKPLPWIRWLKDGYSVSSVSVLYSFYWKGLCNTFKRNASIFHKAIIECIHSAPYQCYQCRLDVLWRSRVGTLQTVIVIFLLCVSMAKGSWSSPVSLLKIQECISASLRTTGEPSTLMQSCVWSVSCTAHIYTNLY